ncbi:hypothetical protein F5Y05DRAFT_61452 [Hypoxylon sp. FL0543]|nr:hypothetical protein F5Y05DRAFT_61452 [Hypoxylon sp. FL0543]
MLIRRNCGNRTSHPRALVPMRLGAEPLGGQGCWVRYVCAIERLASACCGVLLVSCRPLPNTRIGGCWASPRIWRVAVLAGMYKATCRVGSSPRRSQPSLLCNFEAGTRQRGSLVLQLFDALRQTIPFSLRKALITAQCGAYTAGYNNSLVLVAQDWFMKPAIRAEKMVRYDVGNNMFAESSC